MSIGENIKTLRKKAGLTQKEVGKKLNVSESAAGQFEKPDANPNFSTLQKLARVLNCDVRDFLDSTRAPLPSLDEQKQTVNSVDSVSDDQAFLAYIRSLGLEVWQDDSEHKPFLSLSGVTVISEIDTVENLKRRIDDQAIAAIKSAVIDLIQTDDEKQLKETLRLLQSL